MNSTVIRRLLTSTLIVIAALGAADCSRDQTPPAPAQLLYASVPDQRAVMIFDAAASDPAMPLSVIKESAPDVPIGVGIDLQKRIYVANRNGNIAICTGPGSNYTIARRIAGPHTELGQITAIAVDGSGGLYVANARDSVGAPRLAIFAGNMGGNILPDHTISGPHTGLTSPVGISIDATGRSFVADHDSGKILVFDAGAQGDAPPLAQIDVDHPASVLIDQELNLFGDSGTTHSVNVFIPMGPESWAHSSTITTAELQSPSGMAVDKDGNLGVAIPGGVAFFAANASGASTPRRILRGPAPFNPAGIVIK